jgi:hypothetical protein
MRISRLAVLAAAITTGLVPAITGGGQAALAAPWAAMAAPSLTRNWVAKNPGGYGASVTISPDGSTVYVTGVANVPVGPGCGPATLAST